MAIITILDVVCGNVFFVKLSDENVHELMDKYNNDVESWMSDNGIDEKLGFHMSECNYMCTDEMPEIFGYDRATQQDTQLFLFS